MRFPILFLFSFVALWMTACEATPSDVVKSPAPEPQVSTSPERTPPPDLTRDEEKTEDGPLGTIREDYARIQARLDSGTLRADTTNFTCRNSDGDFFLVRYFDGEEVLMLRTTTGVGHAFTTTRYYFAAGDPIFVWTVDEQFGPVSPPEGSDEAGWESEYTETRYYVHDGEVIRQLTKTYEEQSWKDNPPPTDIPNRAVEVGAGTRIPHLDQLEAWKGGRVDC